MATAEYAHISLNSDNVPMITGTRFKVRVIVIDHISQGWDARDIQRQYPHLTLGQIHSALAYYYDHKTEMEVEIQESRQEGELLMGELGKLQGPQVTREELMARLRPP